MDTGLGPARVVGFRRHLRVDVVEGRGAYVFSEHGVTWLQGPHMDKLAGLLDGTRDAATLLRALSGAMAPRRTAQLLAQLGDAGLVDLRAPAGSPAGADALGYWDATGLDAATAMHAVASGTVGLTAVGGVATSGVVSAMRACGLNVRVDAGPDAGPVHLAVVLCDDYLRPELGAIDAALRGANVPWLLAKPVGTRVWIGPVFQPSTPGCWTCLARRLWGHRRAEACAQTELGRTGPARRPAPSLAPVMAVAANLIALEATKWLAGHRSAAQRSVWTLDSVDLVGRHHPMPVYPQCCLCGDPDIVREQARRPVVLSRRAKACCRGNGHRSSSAEQTWVRYQHLVSPVTGVIKEIRRDGRGPEFFNSFRSGANVAAQVSTLDTFRANLRAESAGKGVDAEQARTGALCEALERYSGNYHGDEERVRGSLRSLGEPAIHPNECQLFHDAQFRDRAGWNRDHGPFQYVCAPFDERAVLDWTPVWSMSSGRHRLLPTAFLYFGAPCAGRQFVSADSNGNAAGSSIEDAILQGLLEIVERDAVALWWYNRTSAPGVDLDAFGEPWIDELRSVHGQLGRAVWALDVSCDVGVPVMVAVSRRVDHPREDIIFGLGAHLDPRVALRRALTELNQMMPTLVEMAGLKRVCNEDPDAQAWWRDATIANQPYLRPDHAVAPRVPADFGYAPRADLRDDVATVQSRLERLGHEVLVLDQTRPDVGLPVVKVVVPGMRPLWARFAPGRLYDVPVKLGRLSAPTEYENLNPMPIFL